MKIVLATDAWYPQTNGVYTTFKNVVEILEKRGHEVHVLGPNYDKFKVLPFQFYPGVDFVWNTWTIGSTIKKINPDAVHIATEGPIGIATRLHCEEHKLNYSTSYHTKFPEYIKERFYIPTKWSFKFIRWIHNKAGCTLVTNEYMKEELAENGFIGEKMKTWSRGVDKENFHPSKRNEILYYGLEKPHIFYLGRVSKEKGIDGFCEIESPGTKIVIGDGPMRKELENRYPDVVFVGEKKHDKDLPEYIASGDVFVFPSMWDTFGVVQLEANACDIPVAGVPGAGQKGYIVNGVNGYIHENLSVAVEECLKIPKGSCRMFIENQYKYSWECCTDIFLDSLQINQ